MSTVPKNFYALNFSESQLEKLVKITESEISQQMVSLQEKETPLREAEQLYQEAKSEYDAIDKELQNNKALLNSLIQFRENKQTNKEIRVVRTTSHLDKSPKPRNKYFKWLDAAEEIIQESGCFLPGDELWNKIFERYPELKGKFKYRSELSVAKSTLLHNIRRASDTFVATGRGKLFSYQNKYGLANWVNGDHTPKPQFLKEFMYS